MEGDIGFVVDFASLSDDDKETLRAAIWLIKWMSDELVSADEAFESGNDLLARQYVGIAAGRIYGLRNGSLKVSKEGFTFPKE